MKNISKTLSALALAAVLACSAAGCAVGPGKWSYKTADATISAGSWIYRTYESYSDAVSKITEANQDNPDFDSQLMDITKEKVEDKNAVDWIFDDAKDKCISLLTVEKLAKDKKAELDAATLESAESMYSQYYKYSDESVAFYEKLGVSEESFLECNIRYNYLYQQLFNKLYGKDGEKEVSDADVQKYYTENYISYYYLSYSLKTTDDDGNSVDIDAETKEKVTANFNKYRNMLNNDKKTTDDVDEAYKTDFEAESAPSSSSAVPIESLDELTISDDLKKAIKESKEKQATVTTIDDTLYLIYRNSAAELAKTIKYQEDVDEDESYISKDNVVYVMKKDEYDKYLEEEKKKLKYETNDSCIAKYSVERLVKLLKEN